MQKTSVNIKRMDCPSEIKMIEGLMENLDPSAKMVFDLESRTVQFYHSVDKDQILDSLKAISLPGDLISSQEVLDHDIPDIAPSVEAKTLKYLLICIQKSLAMIDRTLQAFYNMVYYRCSGDTATNKKDRR